jgi:hypothetical protein
LADERDVASNAGEICDLSKIGFGCGAADVELQIHVLPGGLRLSQHHHAIECARILLFEAVMLTDVPCQGVICATVLKNVQTTQASVVLLVNTRDSG